MATSQFDMGVVSKVTITMSDGNEMSFDNAVVNVNLEQETINHYSFGNPVPDKSVVLNERTNIDITTNNEEDFFKAVRLIREE